MTHSEPHINSLPPQFHLYAKQSNADLYFLSIITGLARCPTPGRRHKQQRAHLHALAVHFVQQFAEPARGSVALVRRRRQRHQQGSEPLLQLTAALQLAVPVGRQVAAPVLQRARPLPPRRRLSECVNTISVYTNYTHPTSAHACIPTLNARTHSTYSVSMSAHPHKPSVQTTNHSSSTHPASAHAQTQPQHTHTHFSERIHTSAQAQTQPQRTQTYLSAHTYIGAVLKKEFWPEFWSATKPPSNHYRKQDMCIKSSKPPNNGSFRTSPPSHTHQPSKRAGQSLTGSTQSPAAPASESGLSAPRP